MQQISHTVKKKKKMHFRFCISMQCCFLFTMKKYMFKPTLDWLVLYTLARKVFELVKEENIKPDSFFFLSFFFWLAQTFKTEKKKTLKLNPDICKLPIMFENLYTWNVLPVWSSISSILSYTLFSTTDTFRSYLHAFIFLPWTYY